MMSEQQEMITANKSGRSGLGPGCDTYRLWYLKQLTHPLWATVTLSLSLSSGDDDTLM